MKKPVVIVLIVLVLGVAYYLISPLFRVIEVQEETPEEMTITAEHFELVGTFGHRVSGTVSIVETDNGRIARYEDFETVNGPNLHVYLAKDLDAREYLDLGPIKGTKGNINYEIPDDVNLSEYRYIMHWCVPFGVLFNYAKLK